MPRSNSPARWLDRDLETGGQSSNSSRTFLPGDAAYVQLARARMNKAEELVATGSRADDAQVVRAGCSPMMLLANRKKR
jgi:hypothetical protein